MTPLLTALSHLTPRWDLAGGQSGTDTRFSTSTLGFALFATLHQSSILVFHTSTTDDNIKP